MLNDSNINFQTKIITQPKKASKSLENAEQLKFSSDTEVSLVMSMWLLMKAEMWQWQQFTNGHRIKEKINLILFLCQNVAEMCVRCGVSDRAGATITTTWHELEVEDKSFIIDKVRY